MENDLKIRKCAGKYYQIGYWKNSRWVNVRQLGTPKKIHKLMSELEELRDKTYQLMAHIKKLEEDKANA